MADSIGVIGLGIMGSAMSRNLIQNGMKVVGYDISAPAADRLREMGGQPLASIAEVVNESSIILTSLPTVDAFASATQAIAQAGAAGKIVIELSVMPLAPRLQAHEQLKQADCILLDCPVSGTGAQAITRDLVVFASGDPQAYEKIRPVLDAIARKQVYLGEFGNGTKMKFIANHLVTIHNVAAAEAFTLADKAGMDRQAVYEALEDSAATSRMFQVRGPLMVKDDYSDATARISMFLKDVRIIGDFAADMHCPTPLFSASTQVYYAADNQGLGDLDTAAVCKVLEGGAGLDGKQ